MITLLAMLILLIIPYLAIEAGSQTIAGNLAQTNLSSSSSVSETVEAPESNIGCDADTPCPEGMACWTLVGSGQEGPSCVAPNPQAWYCTGGTKPVVTKSDPPAISCQ
jgi:hypothetical protein